MEKTIYKPKYEIEYIANPYHYNKRLIMMITGLTLDEVSSVAPSRESWYVRDFKNTLRDLGYNTDSRLQPFDKLTELPAILVTAEINNPKGAWYAAVYNGGKVYQPGTGIISIDEYNDNHFFEVPVFTKGMLRAWL